MASEKGDGRGARGRTGEQAAQALLEREGYRIVDANVRFGAKSGLIGELDIVAWDGPTLCFVEVKTRRGSPATVFPGESVTPAKQRQIARLALAYTSRCGLLSDSGDSAGDSGDSAGDSGDSAGDADSDDGPPLRFDVVTVVLAPGDVDDADTRVRQARLTRGAFLAPDDFAEE